MPNGTHPESARSRLQVICFLGPHREQGLCSLLMKATHSLRQGPCTHLYADTHWVWNKAVKWPFWGTNPLLGIKSLAKCLLFKFPGPLIVIFIPLRLGEKKNQSWIWSVFWKSVFDSRTPVTEWARSKGATLLVAAYCPARSALLSSCVWGKGLKPGD